MLIKRNLSFSLPAGILVILIFTSCTLGGKSDKDTDKDTDKDKDTGTLVWSDEFDGETLNLEYWSAEEGNGPGGWGNNELQYYTDRHENLRIEDFPGGGRGLIIEARKEGYGGFGYTSARIKTEGKVSWTYGRIEARIKLPEGQGIWPAFWMLGENFSSEGWPVCGEIDIMELVGHAPGTTHGTLHYGHPYQYFGEDFSLGGGEKFSQDFHVFAIEWEEEEIRWYVDDRLFYTEDKWHSSLGPYPAPFNKPFFILLNMAVGGNWPGPPNASTSFPQKMYIDYVRVYE